jgi:lipooligosaccharide transport system permease protein
MNIIRNLSWRFWRVWQRNFDVYLATWKINFIPPLFEPFLYLVAFGYGFGGFVKDISYAGHGVTYLKFIAPGLVAAAVMNHGFFETTYATFVRMYYQKTFDAILATPLMIEDVALGELVWGATKATMAGAIMFLVAVGMRILPLSAGPALMLVLFAGGLAFSGIGMCFTAVVKNIEMFNFPVFLFVTPMFLFSGIFFPTQTLPAWAQFVANVLPLTFLVSALRVLTLGHAPLAVAGYTGALLALGIVSAAVSMKLMKKRLLK